MARRTRDTDFAPAERASRKTILSQSREVLKTALLQGLLDAVSEGVVILNKERQIVFSNRNFLSFMRVKEREKIYGLRPDEALRCVHAFEAPGGGGTTEFCKNCGLVNAILASQKRKTEITECRILRAPHGEALDLLVKASPISLGKGTYTLLAVQDISHEKRRRVLEQIFFHDVLNTAMSIHINSELLQTAPPDEIDRYREPIFRGVRQLIEEINGQKALFSAERGDLSLRFARVDSWALLDDVVRLYENHHLASGKLLQIHPRSQAVFLSTDKTIVLRVLDNMVKNALEAATPGDRVTLRCARDGGGVKFTVHNPGFMPRIVQLQVFQRSFSTKGPGRGLGTYGMKLLTEKYLEGKVTFRTSETRGTTFSLWCPSLPGRK